MNYNGLPGVTFEKLPTWILPLAFAVKATLNLSNASWLIINCFYFIIFFCVCVHYFVFSLWTRYINIDEELHWNKSGNLKQIYTTHRGKVTAIFPPEKIIKPYYNTWNNLDSNCLRWTFFCYTIFLHMLIIILISTTIPKLASWCAAEFVHKIRTAIPDRDCSGPITAVAVPMKTDLP